ncbi:MAG: response regulator transcription factor [Oscillospiraceae bacterium]|nr:response regulator transcription factor [Oscillospiraceae bacterium]
MKQTIAIIEDDLHIGNMVEEVLRSEGYDTLRAYSGTEALLLLGSRKPDLVLLDLNLPGMNGEEILPKIKDIPVIIVSARADTSDKVDILLGGAADYITKPFEIKALLASITVQLRRPQASGSSAVLTFNELELHTDTLTAVINSEEIRLTRTECAILKLLMLNPNVPVGRTTILDRISEDTPDCTEGSLKQHISNMRKKLEAVGGKDYIEAVYGIGFKMRS